MTISNRLRFIWLLRKAQFFSYCASYNHFATSHLPNICLLQIDKLVQHWKSTYLVTVRRKIVRQLQIAYLKNISTIYMATAQSQFLGYCASIIFLLRISQLFKYCISTNYLTTGNRLHNC